MATSTTAASARISTPGRNSAIAAGAIRTCCPISSGWSGGSARGGWFRGRDGNLTVTTMDWRDPLCEAFMAGAMSLGIPRNPDYNGAIQEGVSYAQRTIQNGLRVSCGDRISASGDEAAERHVRTHAHATNIIFEGKRAVGVRYIKGGKGGTRSKYGPTRKSFWPAAPTTRRNCCNCQASARRSLAFARHRGASRAYRRRRGIAGPLAPRSVARVKNIKTINELRRGLSLWVEALKWATTRRGCCRCRRPWSIASAFRRTGARPAIDLLRRRAARRACRASSRTSPA